ncbi:MAG: Xaa-Pro peptidase family protein [Muribaculum sp.]|nr:Xaa-Pro peptidase family protein [Muribaculum sp.]
MELHTFTSSEELELRYDKIRRAMCDYGLDALLVSSNPNLYYTTGTIISGWVYIPHDGDVLYLVHRPERLTGKNIHSVRKPELIVDTLRSLGVTLPSRLGIELQSLDYNSALRLIKAFDGIETADGSGALYAARYVKTDYEISLQKQSGVRHSAVYSRIPGMYQSGMTDIELQIEIERTLRREGCLGQMRVAGDTMEIFMSNVLVGENADNPSPYDFAMGGAGMDPSLPVGANGTLIQPGMSVMVDANGNFTGYMTDMTRVFSLGTLSDLAMKAHECSIRICDELAKAGRPGVKASELYELAVSIAADNGLSHYFMGHNQKAGFVGHGIGIELNEAPVLAPRSRHILAEGNSIAIEPKFVIPDTGAVGIENTYIVRTDGMECITSAPKQIIPLQ